MICVFYAVLIQFMFSKPVVSATHPPLRSPLPAVNSERVCKYRIKILIGKKNLTKHAKSTIRRKRQPIHLNRRNCKSDSADDCFALPFTGLDLLPCCYLKSFEETSKNRIVPVFSTYNNKTINMC